MNRKELANKMYLFLKQNTNRKEMGKLHALYEIVERAEYGIS